MPAHEVLRKRLARFELSGGARWTKDPVAIGIESIGKPASQWRFGADHRQVDRPAP